MTADTFFRVVETLGRQCWVRTWLSWPAPGRPEYAVMALHCAALDGGGAWRDVEPDPFTAQMERAGFRREFSAGLGWVWLADRTHADGKPFVIGEPVARPEER